MNHTAKDSTVEQLAAKLESLALQHSAHTITTLPARTARQDGPIRLMASRVARAVMGGLGTGDSGGACLDTE